MFNQPLIGPDGESTVSSKPTGVRAAMLKYAMWTAFWAAPIVIPRLSRSMVLALATLLGNLTYLGMGRQRKREALANLSVAFGDTLSMKQKREIVRLSLCNMLRVSLDLVWFSRDREQRLKKYVWYDSSCDECPIEPPGIGVTAHFGNWELLNHVLPMFRNIPLAVPYAPPRDPDFRRFLEKMRAGTGTIFVPRHGSGAALWEALTVQRRSVALVLDQNELPSHGGGFVKFFGLPVPAPLAAARLAQWSELPIVTIFCAPDTRGRYRVSARQPDLSSDDPNAQLDPSFITQRIMNVLEDEIRRRPELWIWTYRRWNYIPFGEVSFSKYPFYAQKVIVPRNLIPRSLRRARQQRVPEMNEAVNKVA